MVEAAAASILKRGVVLDNQKRFTEALICYQEGLQVLIDSMKGISDPEKKKYIREKIESYIKRAETVKNFIEKEKESGKYHEQIFIENDSTGHSYDKLFGRFLDDSISEVVVEDPYIRIFHQCQNFLRLCELLVKSCENLKKIVLVTSADTNNKDQSQWLDIIKRSLSRYKTDLQVIYSTTLHDRQIKLSNGWVIKIGRGLDYFKAPETKFSLGFYDLDLRPCHETTVNIFHLKDTKLTYG